jgi:CRISPR-associated protein (TIGR02710 family)
LARWDRFDHKAAWLKLEDGLDNAALWAESLRASGHGAILEDLARGKDEPRVTLCQDLLENARRREAQGRLDDALARLYRFTEACVQTRLYDRYKLKSGELNMSDLPPKLAGQLTPSGYPPRYKTGLLQTVNVLRHKDQADPVADAYFFGDERGPRWLVRRNSSILAHGYSAVEPQVVKEAFAWIKDKLVPAMRMPLMPPFPTKPTLG